MTAGGGRFSPGGRRLAVAALAAVSVTAVALLVAAIALSGGDRVGRVETRPAQDGPTRIGYVPYWDQERGFDVVRENLDLFDEISPVWYSLDSAGRVVLTDAEHTTVDLKTVRFLQDEGIRVIPTVTNLRDGEWEPGLVGEMLHDPAAMSAHVRELTDLAVSQGYDGIDIDYEHLRAEDRRPFSAFLEELAAALHAEGKVLTVDVHPKTSEEGVDGRNEAQDFRAIGAVADQVRVMTYDYSWEDSAPGPVAPVEWMEEVIAWTVTRIPADKVMLGIVLLGYDWADGMGSTVDYEQAIEQAEAHGATIQRSEDGSPWFAYESESGSSHEVWFEDATSVQAKLGLVEEYGLGGAFLWRLGGEDPDVWPVLGAATNVEE